MISFHTIQRFFSVVWLLWKRDVLQYWRNKTRAIISLSMPIMWLFVFGGGLSSSLSGGGNDTFSQLGINYTEFIFPGVMAMSLIFNAIFSTLNTIKDKEAGFLKEILVAPVPRSTIIIGRALGAASTAATQATLILLLAPFIGVSISLPMLLALLPTIWVVALSLTSIGMLLVTVFDNQESFQYVVNFVNMPMFFLSGGLFPLANAPMWMEPLVRLNPASYAVDAMRRIVLGFQGVPTDTINSLSFTLFNYPLSVALDITILGLFSATLLTIASILINRNP